MRSSIMGTLIPTITMHTIRINHKLKHLLLTLKLINKLKSILEMHIVVTRTVSQHKHDRSNRSGRTGIRSIIGRISGNL